jgi:ribosomal protein S27AE
MEKPLSIADIQPITHCENCSRAVFQTMAWHRGRPLPTGFDQNNRRRFVAYYGFQRWVCGVCYPTAREAWQ